MYNGRHGRHAIGVLVELTKKLFLVTTETSGDLLAGRLLEEMKPSLPDLIIDGVGGDNAIAAGMTPHCHVRDFNVMGLFEVLSDLKRLKGLFNQLVTRVKETKPDLILLIDAPDFNLRFAKAVKGLGIPVVYYVSPQVWAWRRKRAKQLAELVDHMMVLFQFETEIYSQYGLPTTWVGHPLVDELKEHGSRDDFFKTHDFDPSRPLVALAPGSRKSEVTRLLPTMLEVVEARRDRYQFALPQAPNVDGTLIKELIGNQPVKILPGLMRPLIRHADAAVVASGTATLETGLLHTPMVVGYKLKPLTFLVARQLVKVAHVALVNIILDKRVAPELIQADFTAEKILPELDALINDPKRRAETLAEFDRLENILGGGGAAARAARVVLEML